MTNGVFSTDIHLEGLQNEATEVRKPRPRFTGHVARSTTVVVETNDEESVAPPATQNVEVLFTTDYSIFKRRGENRRIDAAHVRRLKVGIKKKNLLHLFPITVNGEIEIMDGQHRLEAAKELKVPIFYIIDKEIGHEDIADINSNKKGWNMLDYINYHGQLGNQTYIKFAQFCNKHKHISPSTLVFLCDGEGTRKTDVIKNGELDISNMQLAETVISHLHYFQGINKKVASQVRFIEAILAIVGTGQYDHSRMCQKLNQMPTKLVPCVDRKAYISVIEDIYNYKAREDAFVKFFKR